MSRILIAECKQEISSFNPVTCEYDQFAIHTGDAIFEYHTDIESEVCGALEVFGLRDDIELVPAYSAKASSAGPLAHESFKRIAAAFLEAVRRNARRIDACYFALHGAMGTTRELDPEGYLLEETRKIIGPEMPLVISLDLHGILTRRMLTHCDGLAIYHTYPHVDFADTGARAARLLLKILDEGARPVVARVRIPVLVRGNELITETGVYGASIRRCQELEKQEGVLAAGLMIGNPFTDVPELCSQAVVITDGDPGRAEKEALQLARDFWEQRALMQPELVSIEEAIDAALSLKGTAIFTDAADAPSSGASGDSNALLAALIARRYPGRVLAPLVDPPAVQKAFEVGVGNSAAFELGGALDPRFEPLTLTATVDMVSRGRHPSESWGSEQDAGRTAVLLSDNFTIVAISRPISLADRSLFLAHGRDPRSYDLIVVKSPHCQPHFFDDWSERNFNVDAPGSTSANLKTLGHTVCRRPIYPLDEGVTFVPAAEIYS